MGEFSPPFSEPPSFFFFFLIPQTLIGSIILLQKFTPHFKILDPRLQGGHKYTLFEQSIRFKSRKMLFQIFQRHETDMGNLVAHFTYLPASQSLEASPTRMKVIQIFQRFLLTVPVNSDLNYLLLHCLIQISMFHG